MPSSRQQFSRWFAILGIGALALTACAEPVAGRAVAQPGAASTGEPDAGSSTVQDPNIAPTTTSSSSSSSSSSSPSSSSSSSSSSTTEEPPEETEEDPEESGGSAPAAGDLTPAGTTLKLTDKATLPFEFIKDEGVFEVSNITVVKGSTDDWAKLDAEEGTTAGLAPWYISFTVTQVSGELAFSYADFGYDLDGVTDQGRDLELSPVLGSAVGCEGGYYDDGYALGDSYTTCAVWETDDRAKVIQMEFRGEYESPYYENPVVWTVG